MKITEEMKAEALHWFYHQYVDPTPPSHVLTIIAALQPSPQSDTVNPDTDLLKRSDAVFEKGEFLGAKKSAEFIKGILQPDKISEAIERLEDGMKRAKEQGWEASVLRHKDVETLIQAATTPAAEVIPDTGDAEEKAEAEKALKWFNEALSGLVTLFAIDGNRNKPLKDEIHFIRKLLARSIKITPAAEVMG